MFKHDYSDYDGSTPLRNAKYERFAQEMSLGKYCGEALQLSYPERNYKDHRATSYGKTLLFRNPEIGKRLEYLKKENVIMIGDDLRRLAMNELEKILRKSEARDTDKVRAAEALNRMSWINTPSGRISNRPLIGDTAAGPRTAVQVNVNAGGGGGGDSDRDWYELIEKLNNPAKVVDVGGVIDVSVEGEEKDE